MYIDDDFFLMASSIISSSSTTAGCIIGQSSSGSVSSHSSEWYPESLRIFTRSFSGYLRMYLS